MSHFRNARPGVLSASASQIMTPVNTQLQAQRHPPCAHRGCCTPGSCTLCSSLPSSSLFLLAVFDTCTISACGFLSAFFFMQIMINALQSSHTGTHLALCAVAALQERAPRVPLRLACHPHARLSMQRAAGQAPPRSCTPGRGEATPAGRSSATPSASEAAPIRSGRATTPAASAPSSSASIARTATTTSVCISC